MRALLLLPLLLFLEGGTPFVGVSADTSPTAATALGYRSGRVAGGVVLTGGAPPSGFVAGFLYADAETTASGWLRPYVRGQLDTRGNGAIYAGTYLMRIGDVDLATEFGAGGSVTERSSSSVVAAAWVVYAFE